MASWMLLILGGGALIGCGDRCEQLCQQTSTRIAACRPDSLAWSDLGARSRQDFANTCREDWARVSHDLTASDLRVALEVCGDTSEALQRMTCDEVLALYLPSE